MKVSLNRSFLILSLILLSCDEERDELQCSTYYLESSTNVNTPGKTKSIYLYNNQGKLSKILDENGNITTQYTYEGNNLIQVDGGQTRWKFAYDITGKVKYANVYIYDFLVPYDSLTFEYIANGQVAKQSHYNLNSFSGNYQFTLKRYSQFEYNNNNGISQKTFETNASIYPAFEQVFTRNFTYDDKPRSGYPELFIYEDASSENPSHINNMILLEFISKSGSTSYSNTKYEYNDDGIVTKIYSGNTLFLIYDYSCDPIFE